NASVKLLVILILFYCAFSGIHTSTVNLQSKTGIQPSSQLHSNVIQTSEVRKNLSQPVPSNTKAWTYEYHGTGADLKHFLFKVFVFFLIVYLYFQIKKQRAVIASISYTVTNKRILVLQTFPGQSLQSVNYVNAKYISVQQTPVH